MKLSVRPALTTAPVVRGLDTDHDRRRGQRCTVLNRPVSLINRGKPVQINRATSWILRKRAWFDIFYEHVNYFRMSDFQRIFGTILSSGRLFGGQYLYVVADLATLRTSFPDKDDEVTFPSDFVTGTLNAATINGPPIVWGTGSKGVIFSLLAERFSNPVQTLIDINPAKAGKFIPGTGLRVH